jgi:hypothetical protein
MLEAKTTDSPAICVEGLLGWLPSHAAIRDVLRKRYDVQIRIAISFRSWNWGVDPTPRALRLLANTRAPCFIDLYAASWEP